MADLSIAPAGAGDAAAIAAIWNHWIATSTITFTNVPKSPGEVAELIAARPGFFVARKGQAVQGFATYFQFRGGPGYAYTMEHTVQLAPDAVGQGIGARLMAGLEDHARAAGYHSMIGGLSAENPAARAFHRAAGYEEVGRVRDAGRKDGRWIDLILMQKMLVPPT